MNESIDRPSTTQGANWGIESKLTLESRNLGAMPSSRSTLPPHPNIEIQVFVLNKKTADLQWVSGNQMRHGIAHQSIRANAQKVGLSKIQQYYFGKWYSSTTWGKFRVNQSNYCHFWTGLVRFCEKSLYYSSLLWSAVSV